MTMFGKKIGLALAVTALPALLAVPVSSAEAGRYYHKNYHKSYHYRGPVHHHHHHKRGGNSLAAGVVGGMIGIVVGSAIASNNNRSYDRVVVRERVITAPPVWNNPDHYGSNYGYQNYGAGSGWHQPVPVSHAQPVPPAQPAGSCMQTREYQTRITVGGREVDAYGTACLQPDGSWKYGAPTPEPY